MIEGDHTLKNSPAILSKIALILLFSVLSGCGGTPPAPPKTSTPSSTATAAPPSPSAVPGTPEDGDWLVMDLPAEMENLNPFTLTDVQAQTICSLVAEGMLERDNATLELKPRLAESWEIAPDKMTYTFHLRKDAVFSDGKPVTAQDVKFSFDTLMNPATNAPSLRNYYQDVQSCEVLDYLSVRFVCNKTYFKHLAILGELPVLPKHVYGTGDFNQHPNNRHPVGSGPYVFERWDTGQQVVLVRNEHYWGIKPHIKKLVFKIITNSDAAFQELQRHGLDTMDPLSMTEELWTTRAATPEFEAQFNKFLYTDAGYRYIGWNMRRAKFQDKRVRQAFTMLLNRELILRELMHGLGEVCSGPFFIDVPENDKNIKPWPFDPERAKKLLDEAGWKDTDGDGVRDRDGVPLQFELMFTSGVTIHEQVATIFQEELAAAGVKMDIRQLEFASLLQSVYEHSFDAIMMAWGSSPDPDPYQIFHSSQSVERGSNHVGYSNPEADKIMEEARLEFDHQKRIEMYHRFHAIVHDEQPYTFLFFRKAKVAVDKRFQNLKVYPYGMDFREWWVPTALQRYRE